jgi:hypothetical protein
MPSLAPGPSPTLLTHRDRAVRKPLLATAVLAVLAAGAVVAAEPAQATHCKVAVAGDIAYSNTGDTATANLIKAQNPSTVIAPGDLAYESGSPSEFSTYYAPTWGAFKSKTLVVPGNHEARTPGFAGIEGYFGDAADDNHAATICDRWRVILVNPYKGISAAASFIRKDGAAHPSKSKIVVWHAPRFSSGKHGDNPTMQPLWDASRGVGARIVLNGHDHSYERFAPMTSGGNRNDASGTREFVSGLGGKSQYPFGTIKPNSQKRYNGQPAVLFLGLSTTTKSYAWTLRSVDGVVRDSGSQPG